MNDNENPAEPNPNNQGPQQPDNADNININTIAKVPFPSMQKIQHIELWFAQMQCWFDLNRVVADNTKYNMVIAHLRHDVLEQVEEIVRAPPLINKFDTIKNTIITRFAESERTRVHQLVSGITLGDDKPSHLLQKLRRANVSKDEVLLKNLWIQRLPIQVQATVSIAQGTLTEVADLADVVIRDRQIREQSIRS